MATLKNRTKRAQVYNLPHAQYCADGQCRCAPITQLIDTHDPQTGERGMASVDKRICSSLTLLAGETKRGLPSTTTSCPDVANAIARGDLKLI